MSLKTISQENYLRTDSVCFTINQAKELVRWNEERKNLKDIASSQYNKIEILEKQIEIKDTIIVKGETIRDTIYHAYEAQYVDYKELIKVNADLHLQKEKYKNKFKTHRRLSFFSSSAFLAFLLTLILS